MDLEKEVISYSYIKEKQELIINYKDGTLNKIENPSKQDVVKVILILLKKAREQNNLIEEQEYLIRLLTVDIEFYTLQELRRKVKETYSEHKYNRFEPVSIESKDNKKL